MKRKISKLFSVLLCAAMLMSLLPISAFAEQTVIKVLNLEGMSEVSIKAFDKASFLPDITCTNHSDKIKIEKDEWYRASDDAPLFPGRVRFESGTDYYYRFKLSVTDNRYVIDSTTNIILDGELIPQENIFNWYGVVYIKTKTLQTDGTKREFLDSLEVRNVQQPNPNSTAADLTAAISTPEGVHYRIAKCEWWVFDSVKKHYVKAENFKNSEKCYLRLSFDFDEGYGMNNNTEIKLSNCSAPATLKKETVPDRPDIDKTKIEMHYKIKNPAPNKVTLNANGGRFVSYGDAETLELETQNDGKIVALPDNTTVIKKDGFYLEGWYTEAADGDRVDIDTVYNADTTVYAHWKPAISEVHFYNVEPMPDRKPVFYHCGTTDYTVNQYWADGDGKAITDMESANSMVEESAILKKYTANTVYEYIGMATAAGDAKFTDDTKIYLNGAPISNSLTRASDELSAHQTYYCADEPEFEVFNQRPVAISAGVSGSSINVDLKDYIGCTEAYTVTGDEEFAAYGLAITDNRYITGFYPSEETDEKDFMLTVTANGESKSLPVHIGQTKTGAFIESVSDNVTADCGGDASLYVKVCTPAGAEVAYDWQYYYDRKYYSIKGLVSLGMFSDLFRGYDTSSLIITDNMQESGQYKCVVKVNGTEVKKSANGNIVKHTVNHKFDSCEGNDSTNHSLVCSRCGYKKDETHIYKYELVKDATDTEIGQYQRVCVKCGYSASSYGTFSKNLTQTNTVLSLFDKRGTDSQPYKAVSVKQYTKTYIPKYRPIKSGYSFMGWTVDRGGQTVDYLPGDEVFVTSGLSLYAVFAETVIAAGGKNITQNNAEGLFGDTVSFTPETSVSPAKLTLNNAHFETDAIYAAPASVGIYASCDLDIELIGDNTIEADSADAIGILGGGKISVYGNGTLTVSGTEKTVYAKGISAKKIESFAEKLYVKDCKTAFDGETALAYGKTEIYCGNCPEADFTALTNGFSQSEYSPMKVIASATASDSAVAASSADNTAYALIAPADISFISYNPDRKNAIAFTPSTAKLYLAQYDETGRLIALETHAVINGEDPIWNCFESSELPVKLMLWNDMSNLQPLCDALTVGQ